MGKWLLLLSLAAKIVSSEGRRRDGSQPTAKDDAYSLLLLKRERDRERERDPVCVSESLKF